MHPRIMHLGFTTIAVAALAACADRTTAPTAPASTAAARVSGAIDHQLSMMDACDPTTFDESVAEKKA